MLFAFFISLIAVTSVFAGRSYNSHSLSSSAPSVACTEELEGIVYVPKNCAYNYLKSINKVLKAQSPLLWNNPAQAKSTVQSFAATYGVFVSFISTMGDIFRYPGDAAPVVGVPKAMGEVYQRAVALGEGFSATDNTPSSFLLPQVSTYASTYWNTDGQMYVVTISLTKDRAPEFC